MPEPDNMVLRLLQEMRAETKAGFAEVRSEIAGVRSEIGDVRSEVRSLRADVASDLMTMEKRFGERLHALNRAVIEYHSTVVGYGELEQRVSRLDSRMDRVAPEGH